MTMLTLILTLAFAEATVALGESEPAPKAREWLASGALPKGEGPGCVGCHK